MNRRDFLKKFTGSILAGIGVASGSFYYAHQMEPTMLEVKREKIISSKIPPAFHQFRIIQFSDTHIGFHYSLEQLEELVHTVNHLNPHIIVFTGDLVDKPNEYKNYEQLSAILSMLKADYGKYWIYGNHDHGGYGTDLIKNVMERANFSLLQNNLQVIEKDFDRLNIAGIDDVMLGKPDLYKTLQNANPNLYTILLAHEPDFVEETINYPVDLQLSGHSHGGQIRLPFVGHIYTPDYAEKYVKGKYDIGSQLTLFVNSGIGTTRLPYRFLCSPEIHIYTLFSKI